MGRFRYPRLLLFVLSFIAAYFLFKSDHIQAVHEVIVGLGYVGTFIAGVMFAYGFTTALAFALLLVLAKSQVVWLAALVGGLGAMTGDYLIFRFIRGGLARELRLLGLMRVMRLVKGGYAGASGVLPRWLQDYLLVLVGGFIIASPLPDELGVSLWAASRRITTRWFLALSVVCNTVGILLVLGVGRLL